MSVESLTEQASASRAHPILRSRAAPLALTLFLAVGLLHALPTLARAQGNPQDTAKSNIALVLSVEDYATYKKSEGSAARAKEIADLLKARGYDVMTAGEAANAVARAALRDLSAKVQGARIALVFILGHGVSGSSQTFFLPSKVTIDRATDLLSRGISLGNIAQILHQAKAGAVCFLMTAPNFDKPVEGVSMRPQFQGTLPPNVAIAVSNSSKIPVSRMDVSAQQATRDVITLLQSKPDVDLKQLLEGCAAHQQGLIAGTIADVRITPPPPAKPQSPEAGKVAAPAPPPPSAPAQPEISEEQLQTLQALEGMLDPRQVRRIQTRLTTLGFYKGPIDAIVGPLTREAIRDYQKSARQAETGYLNPTQLKDLVEAQ